MRREGSGQSIEKAPPSLTIMARWSELSVVMGDKSESIAMCGVAMVRFDEEGIPVLGKRLSWSILRSTSSEATRESWIESPLFAAEESDVEEYQAG